MLSNRTRPAVISPLPLVGRGRGLGSRSRCAAVPRSARAPPPPPPPAGGGGGGGPTGGEGEERVSAGGNGENVRSTDAINRRGVCPGLTAPMPTGDGLLVRLMPTEPMRPAAFAGFCGAARQHGKGQIEIY